MSLSLIRECTPLDEVGDEQTLLLGALGSVMGVEPCLPCSLDRLPRDNPRRRQADWLIAAFAAWSKTESDEGGACMPFPHGDDFARQQAGLPDLQTYFSGLAIFCRQLLLLRGSPSADFLKTVAACLDCPVPESGSIVGRFLAQRALRRVEGLSTMEGLELLFPLFEGELARFSGSPYNTERRLWGLPLILRPLRAPSSGL